MGNDGARGEFEFAWTVVKNEQRIKSKKQGLLS
jgi:hypothetical protein